MEPKQQLVSSYKDTWCLSADDDSTVLIYSLTGSAIDLGSRLKPEDYSGLWFDPRTGNVKDIESSPGVVINGKIEKPSNDEWLLLLKGKKNSK